MSIYIKKPFDLLAKNFIYLFIFTKFSIIYFQTEIIIKLLSKLLIAVFHFSVQSFNKLKKCNLKFMNIF